MRIVLVTETYPPEVNGVARTIGLMAEGLQRRGHFVELVRPRQNGRDHAVHNGSFREILVGGIPIPRYTQLKVGLPSRRTLEHRWKEERPDMVHVATEGPLGWSALAAARQLGIRVATDFHTNFHAYTRDYGLGWLARPVAAYLRSFHNRAECTMVPTRQIADELATQRFERLRVVGRGVDADVFAPARRSTELRASWGADEGTLVALCVSRFAHEKNFALVIQAYEAMRRIRPDARLVLVGEGPLKKRLQQQNVGYVIAGRKVDGELARHYASADVFLFPSMSETFGNVTLEAMASGLGIVAYDYAAAREVLRHGESALLAPFGEAPTFIAHAERFAREPELAPRLGKNARVAAAVCTWDRIVADFEAVLLDVAS
ncbi:MAG TPA: glycosyltransferase family 1 protein [Burkholderiales bacterium]|nr:glycosyltransferase family 1 protein [Burkholderiales bacterium]